MSDDIPQEIILIAGRGSYPLALASSARRHGLRRLEVIGFRGETDRAVAAFADRVQWIPMGRFQEMLDAMSATGLRHAVMAGQIAPRNIFRVRPDARMFALLRRIRHRNAETIFGAIGEELRGAGIELLPAHLFMEDAMPGPGPITRRVPDEREAADAALGMRLAKAISGLEIGQTVVLKEGIVLAVEAFEGTDEAIRRGGRLGGAGAVAVKVAKDRHDMRFDIPVIGLGTFRALRRARVSALAFEAGRTIVLDGGKLAAAADRAGIAIFGVEGAGAPRG